MTNKGKLIVISGPSGAGKGTVVKVLTDKHSDFVCSVSATTRGPREGEVEGVDYFFMSKEGFEDLIKNNGLFEYATYNNNYYGTPRKFVEDNLDAGINVILEIDVQGAFQIKKLFPEAVFVFITPESYEVLCDRLRSRGTEDEKTILNRLAIAKKEAPSALDYDYIIVNRDGEIEMAAEEIYLCVTDDNYKQADDNRSVIATYLS